MTGHVRTLATGLGFTEGPVVTPDGKILITSLTLGHIYRVSPDAPPQLFADVGGGANGATLGADGTLYVAQTGGRTLRNGPAYPPSMTSGIQRVHPDGSVDWLTQDPVSPNDLCFGPDGWLYSTDPTRAADTRDARIWRTDPADGSSELIVSVPWWANGIAFGPDDALYVASTYNRRILRSTDEGRTFETVITLPQGEPDGFAFDADGRLVIAVLGRDRPASIQTWTAAGEHVSSLTVSDSPMITNVAFTPTGDLVVADSSAEGALRVEGFGAGLALHPFR